MADSDPAAIPASGEQAMAERRHAMMVERLSALHEARRRDAAALRSESSAPGAAAAPQFESVAGFLSRFSDAKRSVEDSLSGVRSDPDPKLALDSASSSIGALEKMVAESSYFLPPYEVRSSLKSISDLKEALEALSSQLIPRKKFSFKSKPSNSKKDPAAASAAAPEEQSVVAVASTNLDLPEPPGFRNRDGEVLVKRFSDASSDFTLSDLDSCEVYLKGRIRALFIHRIRSCRVFAGPVAGSVHAEGLDGCVLMLASHQIRIHDAKLTDFYLRLRSRPIIEDCGGVRFAPYPLAYRGIESELEVSGLEEENGNWAKVDDFRWLRAVPSPNWCVVPEDQRLGFTDITDKEECQFN